MNQCINEILTKLYIFELQDGDKPVSFIDNYENIYQNTKHKYVSEAKRVRHESH